MSTISYNSNSLRGDKEPSEASHWHLLETPIDALLLKVDDNTENENRIIPVQTRIELSGGSVEDGIENEVELDSDYISRNCVSRR